MESYIARGTLLHASECWPLRREVQRLLRNERAVLRWMPITKLEDNVSLSTKYGRLNRAPLESKLKLNCLRCYGHMERGDKWINKCTHLEIDGIKGEDLVKLGVKQ